MDAMGPRAVIAMFSEASIMLKADSRLLKPGHKDVTLETLIEPKLLITASQLG
jgi:hypothetical protein